MLQILNQYVKEECTVTEFTNDGITVSHIVKTPIQTESQPEQLQPTIEDKINYMYYKNMGVI